MWPTRTSLLLAALTLLLPLAASADDVGPHPDIRAIRAQLPVLLARRMDFLGDSRSGFRVDDVIVDGDRAVAAWSDRDDAGLVSMERRSDLWWLRAEVVAQKQHDGRIGWFAYTPGEFLLHCNPPQVDDANLAQALDVDGPLAGVIRQHIPLVAHVATSTTPDPKHQSDLPAKTCDPSYVGIRDYTDGFGATLDGPEATLASLTFRGRAPTVAEMPPTPGSNGYYYFYLTNTSSQPVTIAAGTTLAVWFPFVLDPTLNYTLTMAFSDPTILPVRAALKDNVLHFALPAFVAPAGTEMIGEIDGNTF